ncbi:hypothetical protein [Streptomyces sp. NPDC014685]|uniref:hypothetical protein n=1 Tax=Streptomyces sp. NPDC014685 TaxID=3364881 RepID=UPI0036F7E87A
MTSVRWGASIKGGSTAPENDHQPDRSASSSNASLRTARLGTGSYPTGIEISEQHAATLTIRPDDFHGEWNYTIPPQAGTPDVPLHPPGPRSHPRTAHTFGAALATHPLLTGLERHDLDGLTASVRDRLDALPPKERPRHRKMTTENIIWAAVLDQRGLSRSLISCLFRVGENQMRGLIKQVRPHLAPSQHGQKLRARPRRVEPSPTCMFARSAA